MIVRAKAHEPLDGRQLPVVPFVEYENSVPFIDTGHPGSYQYTHSVIGQLGIKIRFRFIALDCAQSRDSSINRQIIVHYN
jgi:hypothetical protein